MLGFSYGFIALEFTLRHPERLSHLLLMGTEPALAPDEEVLANARGIPGAELHVLEKSGHLPHVEEPEATFAAVRDGVARHR